MKENVTVKIKGLDVTSDEFSKKGDNQAIEIISQGKYKKVNASDYIKYDEFYEDFKETGTSIIKISDEVIEISKKGPVTTKMKFKIADETQASYDTPFGTFKMTIKTHSLLIEHSENAITARIAYQLWMNSQFVSECNVSIEINSI